MSIKSIICVGVAATTLTGFATLPAWTNSPAPPPNEPQGRVVEDPINRLSLQQAITNANTELHRILTPNQYQKLQEIEQQHQRPTPGAGSGGSQAR